MAFVKESCGRRSSNLFSIVTLWFAVQASLTRGFLEDQYIGCFYDSGQPTVSSADISTDNAMTIEKCIAKCQTTYATIQNRNTCLCREDYGAQLPDTTCNLMCSGNNSEFCGGPLNAYVVYTVCPTGTYGAACDKSCHCKREIPCDRTTGNCPDGCHGNWSGSACNITTVARQYIGCYRDEDNPRAMEERVSKADNKNTIESCSQSCVDRNYSYAGAQYSWQCYCGDSYARHGISYDCNMSCSGNRSEICGGSYALSVYSVCPAGNYGLSCRGRCHCLNDKRCIYRNGSCPSRQCKPGWTGSNCNIRDCQQNNGDCYINETCSIIALKYSDIAMCRCSNGFYRNKTWDNCTDIDECAKGECDPETTNCSNTVGSYNCTCRSGFQRHDHTTCIDIDECLGNIDDCDKSSTNCNNTRGSYSCICKEGFIESDTTSCTDIDECAKGVCDSETTNCSNTVGSYNCTCRSGFQRHNRTTCIDIDECQKNIDKCNKSSTNCNNNRGSYSCICKEGFKANDTTSCTDIDECSPPWSKCGSRAYNCTNTMGNYYCTCPNGEIGYECISPPDNEGKTIGAIVGSILGAALIAAVAVVLTCICRKKSSHEITSRRRTDSSGI